jgi:SnoaL-like domain
MSAPAPGEVTPQQVVVRYWNEVVGRGRFELLDELVADRYVTHSLDGTIIRTRAELRADLVRFARSMHPVTTIDDQTVDGTNVWSRLTSRGVNVETAEPVTIRWLTVSRVVDGRLVESWLLHAMGAGWDD